MSLPFSRDQFIEVFRSYNNAIGVAPILLLAVAVAVVVLAYSTRTGRHRMIAGLLALLWLWSGVVYHWGFFAAINPLARLFGALFVAQAVLLVFTGVIQGRLQFDPRHTAASRIGWLLIVYALAVYPLLGRMFGHGYPGGPTFGAPCPTTIFFLGTTLWIVGSPPLPVAIPVIWSLIGTSAAVSLGMREDIGLAVGSVIVLIVLMRQRAQRGRLTPSIGLYADARRTSAPR